ncbi:Histone-like transcription factor (CBF/NF-Y) [Gracilaria domingensis]|nr:Histone-like transcription factor (CBF/NF-Y) [Gracilaria domingensis]
MKRQRRAASHTALCLRASARACVSHAAMSDIALPKATVNKFANDVAASLDVRLTADTRELIAECCTEFVQLLSSEANEICEKDNKKTITPEHVLRALEQLGLQKFRSDVVHEYERAKREEKSRLKGSSRRERNKQRSEQDNEELLRQQERLFALARSDPMAMNPPDQN